jgi:flagellar FliJ protein
MPKKFRFALQPVLDLRERLEQEKQQALAVRQRAHDEAKNELQRLDEEFRSSALELRAQHRAFDAEALRMHYAHLQFLDRAIDAQQKLLAERRAAVDRARTELLAASKDRKVVDRLRVRRHEAHVAEEMRIEEREIDDNNARRYGRAQG